MHAERVVHLPSELAFSTPCPHSLFVQFWNIYYAIVHVIMLVSASPSTMTSTWRNTLALSLLADDQLFLVPPSPGVGFVDTPALYRYRDQAIASRVLVTSSPRSGRCTPSAGFIGPA